MIIIIIVIIIIIIIPLIIITIVYLPPPPWCISCYHHHHHHHYHHHCHSLLAPAPHQSYLRSFGRMISPFLYPKVITFQHNLDFQLRRSSYFVNMKWEIVFVFQTKTHSVFELQRSYLNLAKVDTLPSSSLNVGVTAIL